MSIFSKFFLGTDKIEKSSKVIKPGTWRVWVMGKKSFLILSLLNLVVGIAGLSVGNMMFGCFNLSLACLCFYMYYERTDH